MERRTFVLSCLTLGIPYASPTVRQDYRRKQQYHIMTGSEYSEPVRIYMWCSMVCGWEYILAGNGAGREEGLLRKIGSSSLEMHQYLGKVISALGLPCDAEPPLSPQDAPFTSVNARKYILTRIPRMWLPMPWSKENELQFYRWDDMMFGREETEIDALIHEFQEFHKRFPKDRYLGAYAELCSVALQAYKKKKANLSKQFAGIEKNYPEFPEIGIMSSWWNAMSLASADPVNAKKAFEHIATKYQNHDWKVVHVATEASSDSSEKWIEMGLVRKP